MFDKIETKVHEIRQQPEHMRVRYVWGAVAITMSIVILIWLISLRINFLQINSDTQTRETVSELRNKFDDMTAESATNQEPISIEELIQQ